MLDNVLFFAIIISILTEKNYVKSTLKDNKLYIELELGEVNEDLLSYLSALEIASKSKASEQEIKKLSDEISANWWHKNKHRFINEDNN